MTDQDQPARQAPSVFLTSVLTLGLASVPSTGHAITTLQELLAVIDANPMLVMGVYLNYSEVLAFDPQATTLVVDGSVIIAHNATVTPVEEASTPGTGPVTEQSEPLDVLPLAISTNVVGGTNSGSIEVDHSFYLASGPTRDAPQLMLPGQAIMAINGTSTQAQVTGSVTMLSNGPPPTLTEISTSAIGASNVGYINVLLSNGVSQSEGR